MLAEAGLERPLHSLVHILRHKTTTVSDNIAVTTCTITEVFQSSGIFATDEPFELVI